MKKNVHLSSKYVRKPSKRINNKELKHILHTEQIRAEVKYNEFFAKACNMLKAGNFIEALSDFNLCVTASKKLSLLKIAKVYFERGCCKDLMKDYSGAITDYSISIKILPNNWAAYNNRAILKLTLNDYIGAIEDSSESIKLNHKYVKAYINRGIAFAILKNYPNAICDFDMAIELDPHSAIAYYNRGYMKAELEFYKEAIEDFDKAIEINPNYEIAHRDRSSTKEKWQTC